MRLQDNIEFPGMPFRILHRRPISKENTRTMTQRTSPLGTTAQAPVLVAAKSGPKFYRVCVAAHLPADWQAMKGVIDTSLEVTAAGCPTTTLVLTVEDQCDLVNVLTKLHEDQRAIMWVDVLR